MSRSNPFKLKPRKAKLTILAFGEGETEKAFLKYLGSVYNTRGCGVSIKYAQAGGKDPEFMISEVVRFIKGSGNFGFVFILMDSDKEITEKTKVKADKNKIKIIQSYPCCEGLLLNILGENCSGKSSDDCKKDFELKYLNKTDKLDHEKYKKIFCDEVLESTRKKIKILDNLINIFQGEFNC